MSRSSVIHPRKIGFNLVSALSFSVSSALIDNMLGIEVRRPMMYDEFVKR